MVCLGKKNFVVLSHELFRDRLVTHMKHLHAGGLARLLSSLQLDHDANVGNAAILFISRHHPISIAIAGRSSQI